MIFITKLSEFVKQEKYAPERISVIFEPIKIRRLQSIRFCHPERREGTVTNYILAY